MNPRFTADALKDARPDGGLRTDTTRAPKQGYRFEFGGIKTNTTPDSLPPTKYAYAQNVRALRDTSVRTRWGLTKLFPTTNLSYVTDLNSYAALATDNLPLIHRAHFLRRDLAGAACERQLPCWHAGIRRVRQSWREHDSVPASGVPRPVDVHRQRL